MNACEFGIGDKIQVDAKYLCNNNLSIMALRNVQENYGAHVCPNGKKLRTERTEIISYTKSRTFHFTDEEMLSNFLLRGKLSLEKTKKIIDNYYTARAIMPDIFQDRDPCQKEIEDVYKYA